MAGMTQRREGRVNAAHPGLANFETEIDVGMRDRGVDGVETAEAEEIVASHGEAGRGKRGHVAQRLRQVEMLRRIRRALMEGCAGESPHAHHQSGVLNLSRLVK